MYANNKYGINHHPQNNYGWQIWLSLTIKIMILMLKGLYIIVHIINLTQATNFTVSVVGDSKLCMHACDTVQLNISQCTR